MAIFLIMNDKLYGMAAHGFQDRGATYTELPDVVPVDLPRLTRLSWELGARVVEDDETTLHSKWEHTGPSWMLSVYRVTSNTVVMRVCTPVGRERFYGAAQSDLTSALPNLNAVPHWQQLSEATV